jgi:hypothetical protein
MKKFFKKTLYYLVFIILFIPMIIFSIGTLSCLFFGNLLSILAEWANV